MGTKIDSVGGSRPERHSVAWPGKGPVQPLLVQPQGLVSLTSSLGASHDKILTLQKSQVNLSPERSLKLKIMQNRVSCPAEL
jgi:hypothetical protein